MTEKIIEANGKEEQGYELRTISVDQLVKHGMHPREDIGDVSSLEKSIQADGLQEPIMVHAVAEDTFEVLDGVRRLQAITNLNLNEAECLVKTGLEPEKAARISYVKNVERRSLTPIEIARYLQKLKDTFGFSHGDLELRGFGSPSSISNSLKLLNLPEEVQDQIHKGKLTSAHGRELLRLPDAKVQKSMAKRFIDHDVTASKAKGRVSNFLKKDKMKAEGKKVKIPETEVPNVFFKDARNMSELDDESIHLVLTSPPYGIGMDYEKDYKLEEILDNNYAVLEESCRVLVPGGVMAINVADINRYKNNKGIREFILVASGYQKVLRKKGVYLSDIIIWHKQKNWSKRDQIFNQNTRHTSYRVMDNFEPVYIFRKEGERQEPDANTVERSYLTNDDWKKYVDGVWNIKANTGQKGHPNQWPEELPARLIKMFSFIGDTVLDPFLGSGTTIKVAKELARHAVGYEIQEQYKPIIMKKLGIEDKAEAQELGVAVPAEEEKEKAGPKPELFFKRSRPDKRKVFGIGTSTPKTKEAEAEE